jgi:thymidine kinase
MGLHLIVGPMKSGKSLELIARVAPYEHAKKKVLYVKSKKHTRDQTVYSRIGINTKASSVDSLSEIHNGFDVIGIDEIHMFPEEDIQAIKSWLKEKKEVFVSGLDLDYSATMTPLIKKILELKPDRIISKVAVCEVCHELRAQFTQILHNGQPVLSGLPHIVPEDGTYEYQARCRDCYVHA